MDFYLGASSLERRRFGIKFCKRDDYIGLPLGLAVGNSQSLGVNFALQIIKVFKHGISSLDSTSLEVMNLGIKFCETKFWGD